MKVLIVEDTLPAALGAKGILVSFKATVSIAETGAKALELANTQAFDLIFMDIGLPDTDGFILTRNIHEKCPLNRNTKVIALTAHTGDDYKLKLSEYGLAGLIIKPLTSANLLETLKLLDIDLPDKE